jgi:hypothetical protein
LTDYVTSARDWLRGGCVHEILVQQQHETAPEGLQRAQSTGIETGGLAPNLCPKILVDKVSPTRRVYGCVLYAHMFIMFVSFCGVYLSGIGICGQCKPTYGSQPGEQITRHVALKIYICETVFYCGCLIEKYHLDSCRKC